MARGKGKGRAKARDGLARAPVREKSARGVAGSLTVVDGNGAGASPGGIPAGAGGPGEIHEIAAADLDQLKARYPDQWEQTGRALVAAVETGHAAGAARFLARARAEAGPWRMRVGKSGQNAKVVQAALPVLVRERMAQLAVKQVVEGVAAVRAGGSTRKTPGGTPVPVQSLRFGLWSGTLVQRLLFRRGLERKPVAMGWWKMLWPLVTEKALLMPLCEPKGIYCFYSKPLIEGLGQLIRAAGPGPVLEIAAGDGTLARFLTAAGTPVQASDDQSWSHSIAFPADVERLEAGAALARHSPRVVLCSWPPPGNGFERRVFRTSSVDRYIVLTTRHRFAAGDWSAYDDAQAAFDRRVDDRLSTLVLPPEVDPVVLVFDRR